VHLRRFRDENFGVRSDPVPNYFSLYPQIAGTVTLPGDAELERREQMLARQLEQVRLAVEQVHSGHRGCMISAAAWCSAFAARYIALSKDIHSDMPSTPPAPGTHVVRSTP
jgi:hypothetical protein